MSVYDECSSDETRRTWAGARVQLGSRFSSVRIEKRSSADAINAPSMVTVVELTAFAVAFLGATFAATAGAEVGAPPAAVGVDEEGAGVPLRLGSALTVRSLPWVLMIAEGNSDNLASNATGNRDFASL